jgi:beta-N-acetylhexosaminidase
MNIKPLVLGVSSHTLEKNEIEILQKINPFGIILFSRNIQNKGQLKELISILKTEIRNDLFILVDQEGGSVQRLSTPEWRAYPNFKNIGDLYNKAPEIALDFSYLMGRLISYDLKLTGIEINCSPCVDIRKEFTSDFLVNRLFSDNSSTVIELATQMIRGFRHENIIPIVKHIPGHGRAVDDSHHKLPTVKASLKELLSDDFSSFKTLNYLPMAMTAHIIYSAIDHKPATISKKTINFIRENIGFDGILITDDINMNALSGKREEKVRVSLDAGCDLVLDCSGDNHIYCDFLYDLPNLDKSYLDKKLDDFRRLKKDEDFANIDNVLEEYCSILESYSEIFV